VRGVDLSARFTPAPESVAAIGTAVLLFVGGYGVAAAAFDGDLGK
jgi:hypothetical protein